MCWLLTQLLGHHCLLTWGLTLEVSLSQWGRRGALLQLFQGLFKHNPLGR